MLKTTSRTALTVVAAALVALLLAHGALAASGGRILWRPWGDSNSRPTA